MKLSWKRSRSPQICCALEWGRQDAAGGVATARSLWRDSPGGSRGGTEGAGDACGAGGREGRERRRRSTGPAASRPSTAVDRPAGPWVAGGWWGGSGEEHSRWGMGPPGGKPCRKAEVAGRSGRKAGGRRAGGGANNGCWVGRGGCGARGEESGRTQAAPTGAGQQCGGGAALLAATLRLVGSLQLHRLPASKKRSGRAR